MGITDKLRQMKQNHDENQKEKQLMNQAKQDAEREARIERIDAYKQNVRIQATAQAQEQGAAKAEQQYRPKPTAQERISAGVGFLETGVTRLGNVSKNLNAPRTTMQSRQSQRMRNNQKVRIKGKTYYLVNQNQPYTPPQQESGMGGSQFQGQRFRELASNVRPQNDLFSMNVGRDWGALTSLPARKTFKKGKSRSMFDW